MKKKSRTGSRFDFMKDKANEKPELIDDRQN